MLSPELIDELRMIAFSELAKPVNRVAALSSLARNGVDTDKVRKTLYSLATDIATPDSVKVRAIDLLDKLDLSTAPQELSQATVAELEQTLLEQYAGKPKQNT